jgi:hypothetical protein
VSELALSKEVDVDLVDNDSRVVDRGGYFKAPEFFAVFVGDGDGFAFSGTKRRMTPGALMRMAKPFVSSWSFEVLISTVWNSRAAACGQSVLGRLSSRLRCEWRVRNVSVWPAWPTCIPANWALSKSKRRPAAAQPFRAKRVCGAMAQPGWNATSDGIAATHTPFGTGPNAVPIVVPAVAAAVVVN